MKPKDRGSDIMKRNKIHHHCMCDNKHLKHHSELEETDSFSSLNPLEED
jgi:hypothetical protein